MSTLLTLENNHAQTSPVSLTLQPTSKINIEDILVDDFPSLDAMLDRIVDDIKQARQARIFSINVHGANISNKNPRFKRLMQEAETMICDGAGIVCASKLLPGLSFAGRYAAGDYMPALLNRLAQENLTAFFLAGEPGVAEQALQNLALQVPHHTVLGCHHGYILNDKALENQVIEKINELKPDILFIGFGMPLQEYWIDENRHRLHVRALFPFGATLDYLSQTVQRCPTWLGDLGLEWLFRFCLEPARMFRRYIVGNPAFMTRIAIRSLKYRFLGQNNAYYHARKLYTELEYGSNN